MEKSSDSKCVLLVSPFCLGLASWSDIYSLFWRGTRKQLEPVFARTAAKLSIFCLVQSPEEDGDCQRWII